MLICMFEPVALQDHDKKILGKVLCFLDRVSVTANEQEDGTPVGPAKFGQRFSRLLFIAVRVACRKNDASARRRKHTRAGFGAPLG